MFGEIYSILEFVVPYSNDYKLCRAGGGIWEAITDAWKQMDEDEDL